MDSLRSRFCDFRRNDAKVCVYSEWKSGVVPVIRKHVGRIDGIGFIVWFLIVGGFVVFLLHREPGSRDAELGPVGGLFG